METGNSFRGERCLKDEEKLKSFLVLSSKIITE